MSGMRLLGYVALLGVLGLSGCSPERREAPNAQSGDALVLPDAAVDRIAASVAKEGAAAYLGRVKDENTDWQTFLADVARGDLKALALAGRLRPAADSGNAEAIDMAVAQALPKSPLAVLDLTNSDRRVDKLCTSPFIEPEPGVEVRYNKAAIRALDHPSLPQRSTPVVQACRRALEQIATRLSDQSG